MAWFHTGSCLCSDEVPDGLSDSSLRIDVDAMSVMMILTGKGSRGVMTSIQQFPELSSQSLTADMSVAGKVSREVLLHTVVYISIY